MSSVAVCARVVVSLGARAIRDVAEIRRGDRRGGDPGPHRDRWGGSKKLPTARLGSGELIGQAVVGEKPVNK